MTTAQEARGSNLAFAELKEKAETTKACTEMAGRRTFGYTHTLTSSQQSGN
jgi:hypothetical protein